MFCGFSNISNQQDFYCLFHYGLYFWVEKFGKEWKIIAKINQFEEEKTHEFKVSWVEEILDVSLLNITFEMWRLGA